MDSVGKTDRLYIKDFQYSINIYLYNSQGFITLSLSLSVSLSLSLSVSPTSYYSQHETTSVKASDATAPEESSGATSHKR